jgi:PAS domain S-box-containing protein
MDPIDQVFSLDNFKLIIEHAPIGIVIIDKNYKWLLTNQRFSQITGYSRDELLNKTFLDITYKEDIQTNLNFYEQMVSGKINEYAYEKRYVRKDGKVIWVRLTVAGVRLSGHYAYMIALIQDIDSDKKNQVDLESRNKELDTLFYKASHDLRAPVATLEGLINLFRRDLPVENNSSFVHLVDTVKKLSAQNDLLVQLAHLSELVSNPVPTSFSSIVNSSLDGRHEDVTVRIDASTDLITTDPTLLTIIFKNLFDNTAVFADVNPEVDVQLSMVGSVYRIVFHDNGPGIPSDLEKKVFDMFFKGSEKSKGSGLGLYMVKKAVEKLKGEIRIITEVIPGTRFEISLPAQ